MSPLCRWFCLLVSLVMISFGPSALRAESPRTERLTFFGDEVRINASGAVDVTETIDVIAQNIQIRHGIYRDFPTDYLDAQGKSFRIGFHVEAATLDGAAVPYHTGRFNGNARVYLGDKDAFVSPGPHRYILRYRTDHLVGHFDDADQLYWNVNGNRWDFPIDKIQSVVVLPQGASMLRQSAYTGPLGSKEQNYRFTKRDDGRLVFETTKPLASHEGLTVAVAWPKGFIASEKPLFYINPETCELAACYLFVALITYYCLAFWLNRRKKGTIIPLFRPPGNLSPGEMHCLYAKNRRQPQAIAASLVNMAVKGYVNISLRWVLPEELEQFSYLRRFIKNTYVLTKGQASQDALSPEERIFADEILGAASTFEMGLSNRNKMKKAIDAYTKDLSQRVFDTHFIAQWKHCWIGLAVWLAAAICLTVGLYGIAEALLPTLFLLSFFSAILISSFFQALKKPTPETLKRLDEIDGFRMYLNTAEKNRFNNLDPEMTPEIFEKYLPYAIALGVENRWAKRFEASLVENGSTTYQPVWYAGDLKHEAFTNSISTFTNDFSTALQESFTSVSSASSGGGSSGGGGGGGGGGGW